MKTIKPTGWILLFAMISSTSLVSAQDRRDVTRNARPTVNSNRQAKQPNNRNLGTISRNNAQFKKETKKVTAFRGVPSGSQRIAYDNHVYQYNNGRFYIENGGRYIPTSPARGLRITQLPPAYARINFGNSLYYYYDGVFYNDRRGYYEVVDPQIGTIVYALPADYEKVVYQGELFYEYNGILYEKVTTYNGKGYRVVGFLN